MFRRHRFPKTLRAILALGAACVTARADLVADTLRYFDPPGALSPGDFLKTIRPRKVPPRARAEALALLPRKGVVAAPADHRHKLDALSSILGYHDRQESMDVMVVDVFQAFTGLYARSAVIISTHALRLLDTGELQAVVAHELGHDYYWTEFAKAFGQRRHAQLQELELRCDGIAVITLLDLGLDPALLTAAIGKIEMFNFRLGPAADAAEYPPRSLRERFIQSLAERRRRAR